jgi:TPR repeat protein
MSLNEAIKLHNTNLFKNQLIAFYIFKELNNNFWLGYYYEQGYAGLKIDYEKAEKYYIIDSLNDNPNAMYKLAILKINNFKYDNEYEKKLENTYISTLLKKSAMLGNLDACFHYSNILFYGKLNNKIDKLTALFFLKYAAERGHKNSIILLYQYNVSHIFIK